jgi:hypothetical protein
MRWAQPSVLVARGATLSRSGAALALTDFAPRHPNLLATLGAVAVLCDGHGTPLSWRESWLLPQAAALSFAMSPEPDASWQQLRALSCRRSSCTPGVTAEKGQWLPFRSPAECAGVLTRRETTPRAAMSTVEQLINSSQVWRSSAAIHAPSSRARPQQLISRVEVVLLVVGLVEREPDGVARPGQAGRHLVHFRHHPAASACHDRDAPGVAELLQDGEAEGWGSRGLICSRGVRSSAANCLLRVLVGGPPGAGWSGAEGVRVRART